jgi:pyochelin biosynthetic protein PchC
LWRHVRGLGGTDDEALANRELRAMLTPMVRSDYRLVETYVPAAGHPLGCPVTALTGRDDSEVRVAEAETWHEVTTGAFDLDVFPGDHFYLVPQRAALLSALMRRLGIPAPAASVRST